MNPEEFGGSYPTPSLARSDKDYHHQTGDYWRGGIWLPTTYMAIKAIESMATMRRPMLLPRRLSTSSLPLTGT